LRWNQRLSNRLSNASTSNPWRASERGARGVSIGVRRGGWAREPDDAVSTSARHAGARQAGEQANHAAAIAAAVRLLTVTPAPFTRPPYGARESPRVGLDDAIRPIPDRATYLMLSWCRTLSKRLSSWGVKLPGI
jgi:hypothetical protein